MGQIQLLQEENFQTPGLVSLKSNLMRSTLMKDTDKFDIYLKVLSEKLDFWNVTFLNLLIQCDFGFAFYYIFPYLSSLIPSWYLSLIFHVLTVTKN